MQLESLFDTITNWAGSLSSKLGRIFLENLHSLFAETDANMNNVKTKTSLKNWQSALCSRALIDSMVSLLRSVGTRSSKLASRPGFGDTSLALTVSKRSPAFAPNGQFRFYDEFIVAFQI